MTAKPDPDVYRGFRAVLVTAMRRLGLSQREVAQRVGVSESTVGKWLHRQTLPSGQFLTRLAEVLGLKSDQLIPGSGRASPVSGEDASAYLTGGRVVLAELQDLLRELEQRWEHQSARGARALEHYQEVERSRGARKRRSKGS